MKYLVLFALLIPTIVNNSYLSCHPIYYSEGFQALWNYPNPPAIHHFKCDDGHICFGGNWPCADTRWK